MSYIRKNIVLFIFGVGLAISLSNGVKAATPKCDTLNGIPVNPNDPACYETQSTSCNWVLRGSMCEVWEDVCSPNGKWHTIEVPIGTNCSKHVETITCRDSSGVKHWINGPWVNYGGKIYINSCDADEIWCTNWGGFPPLTPVLENECHYTTVKTWGACDPTSGVQVATSVNQLSIAGTSCANEPTVRSCTVNSSCGTRNTNYASTVIDWPTGSKYCSSGIQDSSPGFPSIGSAVKWNCNGLNGGKSEPCEASHTAGICGTRNGKSYASTVTSWPNADTSCANNEASSPANVSFPSQGSSAYWNCSGTNCSAYHQSPAAPTLNFTGDPISLPSPGGVTKLSWVPSGASYCWAESPSNWRGWKINTGGERNISINSTTVFDLECWNSAGVSTGRKYVTVNLVAPTNASCGTNAKIYNASDSSFDGTWCSLGTVSFKNGVAPTFPNQGQISNAWSCLGSGGGTDATGCEASRKLSAPTVDLKINNSNGPIVSVNRDNVDNLDFSWNVTKNTSSVGVSTYCSKNGDTWGTGQIIPPKNLIDSDNNFPLPGAPYPKNYSLTCHNGNGNASLNSIDASETLGVTVNCNVREEWSGCTKECGLPSETERCTRTNANCTTSSCGIKNCDYDPCPVSSEWIEVAP